MQQSGDKEYYKDKNNNWTEVTDEEKIKNKNIELKTYADYKEKTYKEKERQVNTGILKESQNLKTKDKLKILQNANYSAEEKTEIYKNYILSNDSAKKKLNLLEKTGITDEKYINEYLKYLQQDFESDIKENGTTKGKTVSGSSKKKTYEYVNNMKITYEQKLMLLGTQYKLNDTERTKLYKYVKSLDYTEDEMKSVFESLKGFTVYKNGKVTW
jgi:hypothetical protein